MMPPRTAGVYVEDILAAIANIEADTAGLDLAAFVTDRRVRQLVERNIEIISEASRRLPADAKASEPDIPWREIAGVGNILRHDYGIVEPDVLWRICAHRLAPLKAAMQRLQARLRV